LKILRQTSSGIPGFSGIWQIASAAFRRIHTYLPPTPGMHPYPRQTVANSLPGKRLLCPKIDNASNRSRPIRPWIVCKSVRSVIWPRLGFGVRGLFQRRSHERVSCAFVSCLYDSYSFNLTFYLHGLAEHYRIKKEILSILLSMFEIFFTSMDAVLRG